MVVVKKNSRNRFLKCKKCKLHPFTKKKCLGTGDMPCDIMLIGEAPTKSETMTGRIYKGKVEIFIKKAISEAQARAGLTTNIKWYITNVIACRPCDSREDAYREPYDTEIWSCQERLNWEVRKAKPKAMITLGSKTKGMLGSISKGSFALQDPRWLMQIGGTSSPQYRKFVADLSAILKGIS